MGASLSNIVDVSVSVSAISAISSDFNLGMLIGDTLQTLKGTVKEYSYDTYQTQMITDGYATTDDEYKAAQIYFSQNPKSSRLAIGTEDTSKTPAENFATLRAANENFYSFAWIDQPSDANIALVAAAVEATSIPTVFYYSSSDPNCLVASTTNILKTLKDANYKRSVGFYSTDTKIIPAIVGLVSAMNSMKENSAYTLAYKVLVGVTAENLTDAQLANLKGYNGNAFCNFGSNYKFVYPAISSGGYYVDELYTIDLAKYLIQLSVLNGLTGERKVPQTESGVTTIISMISSACNSLRRIGVIDSGIWGGGTVGELNNGEAIQDGFYIYAGSVADMSASDKAARKSPTILVALHSSGAIEHVVIHVYIDR